MDDIIKLVKDKAGISDDAAQKAVNTVLGFIKGKLPGPVASQIDGVVGPTLGSKKGGMLGGTE